MAREHSRLKSAGRGSGNGAVHRAGGGSEKKLEGIPAKVYLFGSWARGEARKYSDIDVAISADGPLPPGLLFEIEEALDSSEVLYPVELVDLTTASSSLRERVAAEGIPWNG